MSPFLFHAGFMALGITVILIGVIIAAGFRTKTWRIKYHRAAGLTGAAFFVSGLIATAFMGDSQGFQIHPLIGIATITAAILTPAIGIMIFKLRKKWMRPAHRWLGRLTLALSFIAAFLGLRLASLI